MKPILSLRGVSKHYENVVACDGVDLDLYPGHIVGIVGESGSGKTTLLRLIAGEIAIDAGSMTYADPDGGELDLVALSEAHRRRLMRSEWGFVRQNPRDGLRMYVSAGANVAERLLEAGVRNYATLRETALGWLREVEIGDEWIDRSPQIFSGGMQQRVQLARVLVTQPRVVLMDEPTGGLDVSVQARLLDLVRSLVRRLHLSVLLVSHDIGVVRLLADTVVVMRGGRIVEGGIADRVLDDPQHPYTQLLTSATLAP